MWYTASMNKTCLLIAVVLSGLNCSENNQQDVFRIGIGNLNYRNDDSFELSKAIINENCDVFFCFEWTSKNLDKKYLKNKGYKFLLNVPKKGTHGICILSRKRFKGKAIIHKAPIKGPCAIPYGMVRMKLNDNYITMLGVHLPPPVRSCKNTTDTSIFEFSKYVKDGVFSDDIGIARKNDIAILAGDFNALPNNKAMHSIKNAGLIDSYKKMNVFPGPTWSPVAWIPAFLRIDYIFTSRKLELVTSKRFKLPESDHSGLVTEINLNK